MDALYILVVKLQEILKILVKETNISSNASLVHMSYVLQILKEKLVNETYISLNVTTI